MWNLDKNKLVRQFIFPDFVSATGFIVQVAIVSEKLHHHPEIIWQYNKVTLNLSTHDAGDIVTDLDYKLAEQTDKLYATFM